MTLRNTRIGVSRGAIVVPGKVRHWRTSAVLAVAAPRR